MGCDQTMKLLPIIDFSDVKQETPTWESVKMQVQKALEEYGCFEAKFDQIPLHVRKSAIEAIQLPLHLPLHTKLLNRSDKPYHAYVGQQAMISLYESLGIEDALSPGKIDAFANLMWPQGNPVFSKSVERFAEQLHELDKIVRNMLLESLGLEKYKAEHIDSTNYLVRFQKYDGCSGSHETKVGLDSHTDKNIITIVYQSDVSGLEVQTKHGDWIAVPSLNSFIVMAGEAFYAWTNGRVHSPHHRVMMSGDETRYSIALFSISKAGYIIKAPDETVDDEHPLLFKPFDPLKYMEFYVSEAGRASPSALKAYCGA